MTQQRSEDTKAQIQTAAVTLFCRSGYDAATVAEICSQAGVSKGAFYHHFPSKKDLFLAIVEQWLEGVNSMLDSFREPQKSVPQSILDMSEVVGTIFSAASGRLPMFMEFMVQASRDQAIWNAAISPYQEYQSQFAQMIEDGKKEGSIKSEIDAQTAAWVLIAFSVGLLLQSVVIPKAADWEKVTKAGMKMFVNELRRSE